MQRLNVNSEVSWSIKKAILILVLGLLWCNVGLAEIKVLEKIQYGEKMDTTKGISAVTSVLCVDGLKFLNSQWQESVSVIQMLGADGKPLTCSMD